jgi:hypothetical protein
MLELYPDMDAPTGIDLGDEFPRSPWPTRYKSPLAADFPDADTTGWIGDPRPALTAWKGADRDAYWYDNGIWRHCQTGEIWQ